MSFHKSADQTSMVSDTVKVCRNSCAEVSRGVRIESWSVAFKPRRRTPHIRRPRRKKGRRKRAAGAID
jgi:hypothetical protein